MGSRCIRASVLPGVSREEHRSRRVFGRRATIKDYRLCKESAFSRRILLTLCLSCRNILEHRAFSYYKWGWSFKLRAQGCHPFARENRSRRHLHGNEEEGKKEETLTV